jgi:hypothetical protein
MLIPKLFERAVIFAPGHARRNEPSVSPLRPASGAKKALKLTN